MTRYFCTSLEPGVLTGIEFAGEVVKVGGNLDPKFSWKVGDRVSGAVHGGTPPELLTTSAY